MIYYEDGNITIRNMIHSDAQIITDEEIAQRMYVKRGHIPDGKGVWYGESVCKPYAPCRNDDDLVLYLSKKCERNEDAL